MADRKLRVGVIGLGFMGELHARVHHELAMVDLVALADIDGVRGAPIAERLGAEFTTDTAELLAREDIDAVSICTPDRLHLEPARAAAQAGKAILLEKPMAHEAGAAEEIARAVETAGTRLMVAHILRFDPRYAQLHGAADPDRLGEPIHLRAKRNTSRALARRLGAGSSILHYLGVHDIDMMQWVGRTRITRVYAQKVEKLGNGNEDALYAVLNFENGAIGVLDYSWAWPNALPCRDYAAFEVVGTTGGAIIDGRDQGLYLISEKTYVQPDIHLWPRVHGAIVGDLRDELQHFAEAVLSGAPFAQPYREALQAIRVLDALFESVATARPVDVVLP